MTSGLILLSGNFPPEKGGPAKFVYDFSRWASSAFQEVYIISTHPSKNLRFDDGKIKVELLSRAQPLIIRYLKSAFRIRLGFKPGWTILANGSLLEMLIASLFGKIDYVVKLPGDIVWEQAVERGKTNLGMLDFQESRLKFRNWLIRRLTTYCLLRARKIIVPSKILAAVCHNWGVPSEKIVLIPNSVDLDVFFHKPYIDKEFDVITVSRLIGIKQIDGLIRTCSDLKLRLLIVGDGPMRPQLELINSELGGYAHFFGAARQEELVDLYNKAKVFVLNSSFEAGTPYALLEARACGLPSIANEGTGCEDVIGHLQDGYICRKREEHSLETGLHYCLDKLKKNEFKVAELVETTRTTYSTSHVYPKILKVLRV